MKKPIPLYEFWKDKPTKDNVHLYLIECLEQEALRKLFNKEDVSAIAEAKEMIDMAFDKMDILFENKVGKKNQVNEAR